MNTHKMKANVKKFSTQGSKGGSIVVALEVPLTEENAMLAYRQNETCIATLDFTDAAEDEFNGQHGLDFGEKGPEDEEGLD